MNKLFLFGAAVIVLFSSCQKETPETVSMQVTERVSNQPGITPVPSTFIKHVLLEHFTGVTDGDAPTNALNAEFIQRSFPGRVTVATLHMNDVMAISHGSRVLQNLGGGNTNAVATIDRKPFAGTTFLDGSRWSTAVSGDLRKPTDCGLAINSTIANHTATAWVVAGFTSTPGAGRNVTAYLVEDMVSSNNSLFAQANNQNSNQLSQFFNQGNPISNFVHANVVRRVLTSTLGNSVNPTTMVPGGSATFTFKFDVPERTGNSTWKIIAFISDATTKEVLNVQEATLGTLKDWN
jgi:Outer membrane protein Omp28